MAFSWKPFFEELLSVVCRDYDATKLASLAHEIFPDTPLKDQYKSGDSGPVKDFDPLTFIGYFNRNNTEAKRTEFCRTIKSKLGLKSQAPTDFKGIPILNPQKSWFFPYAKEREDNVFSKLWKFARALDKNQLTDSLFSDVLNIKGVGLSKLTQLCFICKPDTYLPLDQNTSEHLRSHDILNELNKVKESESFSDYRALLEVVKRRFPSRSMAEISSDAWGAEAKTPSRYWLVGAVWGEEDKSQEFIQKSEWINGFTAESKDKSLDEVRRIAVGDLIAIKSSFVKEKSISCIRVKAVGRVTQNIGDGRHLKVEWIHKGSPFDVDGTSYRQTVHEVKDTVDQQLIFHNSYRSTRKEGRPALRLADQPRTNNTLPKNLILFGPPGVGKTHQILALRSKFTSSDGADDTTKIANWISQQSWWTSIAAAVIDLNRTVSVSEIESHPFIQAKIKLSTNNTPRNTIWGWLQRHTIQESKTVAVKQRNEPLVFDKTEDSKWFLTGDWQESLADLKAEVHTLRSKSSEAIKRFEVVTFHQAYSYEDFVEGIRPVTSENSDTLTYTIESGIFKRLCERAKADPQNDYALFIDEINRGNIAKIFGELITLIEEDKREGASNATTTMLPYSKTEFSVPSNLHVIGTMNSVDRSIALLDMALRRRFQFQKISPDPNLVIDDIEGINFRAIYTELNDRLALLMGEDYQLGHSYFMKDKITSADQLKEVWFGNILPLFQEYFFDDWEKLKALVPAFIESKEVRGLNDLGLLHSSKNGFISPDIDTEDFLTRLKELSTFLKAA